MSLSPQYHEYFIGLICSNYWNSTQFVRLITRRKKKRIYDCKYMKTIYVTQLRSSSENRPEKYSGPYRISTHDHCNTGTALCGNAEVMGSNPVRT